MDLTLVCNCSPLNESAVGGGEEGGRGGEGYTSRLMRKIPSCLCTTDYDPLGCWNRSGPALLQVDFGCAFLLTERFADTPHIFVRGAVSPPLALLPPPAFADLVPICRASSASHSTISERWSTPLATPPSLDSASSQSRARPALSFLYVMVWVSGSYLVCICTKMLVGASIPVR